MSDTKTIVVFGSIVDGHRRFAALQTVAAERGIVLRLAEPGEIAPDHDLEPVVLTHDLLEDRVQDRGADILAAVASLAIIPFATERRVCANTLLVQDRDRQHDAAITRAIRADMVEDRQERVETLRKSRGGFRNDNRRHEQKLRQYRAPGRVGRRG